MNSIPQNPWTLYFEFFTKFDPCKSVWENIESLGSQSTEKTTTLAICIIENLQLPYNIRPIVRANSDAPIQFKVLSARWIAKTQYTEIVSNSIKYALLFIEFRTQILVKCSWQ